MKPLLALAATRPLRVRLRRERLLDLRDQRPAGIPMLGCRRLSSEGLRREDRVRCPADGRDGWVTTDGVRNGLVTSLEELCLRCAEGRGWTGLRAFVCVAEQGKWEQQSGLYRMSCLS